MCKNNYFWRKNIMSEPRVDEYQVDLSGGRDTYVTEYGKYIDSLTDTEPNERERLKEWFANLDEGRQFATIFMIKRCQDDEKIQSFALNNGPFGFLGPDNDGY